MGPQPMLSILTFASGLLELLNRLSTRSLRVFGPAIATVGLQMMLYVGWNCVQQGSLADGLRAAFVDNQADSELRRRNAYTAVTAAEIREMAHATELIDNSMNKIRNTANAARARLAVIHNGALGVTGAALMRFDIIHAVAAPGRSVGEMVHDGPLADWAYYMPILMRDECDARSVADMKFPSNGMERARMEAMNVAYRLACPVADNDGVLLGGLFLTWDQNDHIPQGAEMAKIVEATRIAARQIATTLSIKPGLGQITPQAMH